MRSSEPTDHLVLGVDGAVEALAHITRDRDFANMDGIDAVV
jgi:hypothetical protein